MQKSTLQGINISHLRKRKIIFKMPFFGDMLVPRRVPSLKPTWHNHWKWIVGRRSFCFLLGHLGPIFRGELLVLRMVFIEFMYIPWKSFATMFYKLIPNKNSMTFSVGFYYRHPKGVCETPVFEWWCWDFQDAPFEGVPYFPAARTLRSLFLRWCLKGHILWKLPKKNTEFHAFKWMDGYF